MPLILAPESRSPEVRALVQMRAGVFAPSGQTQVLGFIDQNTNDLVGGWMFERYTGRGGSVYAHWAAAHKGWLSRSSLAVVALYLFDQLGVQQVFGEVRASDTYVRQIMERLGFVNVATLEDYFPDGDLLLYSLSKRDCKWLPAAFKEDVDGQEKQSSERS